MHRSGQSLIGTNTSSFDAELNVRKCIGQASLTGTGSEASLNAHALGTLRAPSAFYRILCFLTGLLSGCVSVFMLLRIAL
jgi:hypothetical protein